MAKTKKAKAWRPGVGSESLEAALARGTRTAKDEAEAAVASAKGDRQRERKEAAARAARFRGRVGGHEFGALGSLVGTAANEAWRRRLADAANVVLVDGGFFMIERYDRGGFGSEYREPQIWFEADVVDGAKPEQPSEQSEDDEDPFGFGDTPDAA